MKWGDIQIESLKKMFLNNDDLEVAKLEEYKKDKKYKTYLFSMPQACNEAIYYLINSGIPFIQSYELEKDNTTNKYELETLIDNFKSISEIFCDEPINYRTIGNNVLIIDNWKTAPITIYYESYIDDITSKTSPNYELEINRELARLIPLYIAGELYKDDDISLATIYMNEFVTNVNRIAEKQNSNNFSNNNIQTVYSIGM